MININIIKKNKLKKIIQNISIPLFITILSLLILSIYTFLGLYNKYQIKSSTFRLHVVSNSNSYEDKLIKTIISNDLEDYLNNMLNINNLTSKEQIIQTININKEDILNNINLKLKEHNKNYTATLKLGSIYYNDKKENIFYTMEKGTYDSLQIVLGKGNGENFWNLIFPNKENIEKLNNLNTILPTISNIYDNNIEITYSSKLIEFINSIF